MHDKKNTKSKPDAKDGSCRGKKIPRTKSNPKSPSGVCLSTSVGGCVFGHILLQARILAMEVGPRSLPSPGCASPQFPFLKPFHLPYPVRRRAATWLRMSASLFDLVDSLRRRQKPSEAAPVPNVRVYTRCLCLCASLHRMVLNTTRVEAPWANAVLSAPPPVRAC